MLKDIRAYQMEMPVHAETFASKGFQEIKPIVN